MSFQTVATKVAVASVLAAGLATTIAQVPAQAFSLGSGDVLQLSGGDSDVKLGGSPIVDFGANGTSPGGLVIGNSSTGGFTSLIGHHGQVADVSLSDLLAGSKNNFLRIFSQVGSTDPNPADDLFFSITQYTGAGITPIGGPFSILGATFKGVFTNAVGATIGEGVISIQLRDKAIQDFLDGKLSTLQSSWSMTIETVPTPALLPGLVGMGISLIRKRKRQLVEMSNA